MRLQSSGALVLGGLSLCSALGQSPPTPTLVPIQAEIPAYLNVRHVSNGTPVFARVTADWSGTDCILRNGAILEGRVESAVWQGRGTHGSRLALSFNKAQCNGTELAPMELVIAAVAAAPVDFANVTNGATLPARSFSSPFLFGGLPVGLAVGTDVFSTTHLDFTGINHHFPMRPNLRYGDVVEINGMKLQIGAGPHGSSVISTKNRDVYLDKYTQLLLLPAWVAIVSAAGPLPAPDTEGVPEASSSAQPPVAPAPALAADLETCAPPGCAVDLPVAAQDLAGQAATAIAIQPLGYAPRPQRLMTDFDDEDALAWLGPQELVLTLNPHTLVRRNGESTNGAPVCLTLASARY